MGLFKRKRGGRGGGGKSKICEQRNANEEKGRDEVKQECKILNVLFSIERKMLNFMVIYLKRKRNIPSPAKDICD
ncbi:MAG: hypothetical protein IPK08_11700 [Bacteroidetes bacterium]|nr:hypothetical protein [Bacteroidota bacterium]